jgi:hypothetical protein
MGLFKKRYKEKHEKNLTWESYRFPDNVTDSLVKKVNETDDQHYLSAFIFACFGKPSTSIAIREFDLMKSERGAMHKYMQERDTLAATAIKKITDPALLVEIAKSVNCQVDLGSHGNYATMYILHLEAAATQKLTDEEFLADVAKNAVSHYAVEEAIKKLSDQNAIAYVAKNHAHIDIRIKAIQKLTNQAVLADIAESDKNIRVRRVAIINLTDQNALADIAKYNTNEEVREAAENRLKELKE